MKKRVLSVLLLLALLCSALMQTAYAVEPRTSGANLSLSFDGTTAICSAICRGNSANAQLSVTMSLYHGDTFLKSWSGSGKLYVGLNEQYPVVSGETYKLVVNLTVDGVAKPETYVTNTCP